MQDALHGKSPSLDKIEKTAKEKNNITDLFSPEQLAVIGQQVVSGFSIDENSCADWRDVVDKALDIAKQVMSVKNDPWPNASNVKFPLICEAAIDYSSRTLPEIIPNERVVKASTVGVDSDGSKYRRGNRVSRCISYQLMVQSDSWEDNIDKLLSILPVLGTVFTKTYYDDIDGRICVDICTPDKVVVNYNSPCLADARRVTHVLECSKNFIIERQRYEVYNDDVDAELLCPDTEWDTFDEDPILTLLEQHCWLDLDGDGYKEPYIVTVHKESQQVLRILPRFKKVEKNSKGLVKRIVSKEYFTDFHFIRSPDGGFYSMGFGTLLLPLNSAINTLINQLIDAGTLSVTQGGFLGRGLRIKNGVMPLKMGGWQVLDAASGTKIADNVFPIPVREPSQTLFSLLSLLIQVGKDLTSSNDMLKGKQPAQNVSNNVANQLIEQGVVVFKAINKRVYRGLKNQYQKIYELNHDYLSQKDYMTILDDPEADVKADFELGSLDIHPVADPNISSDQQRLSRASIIQGLRSVDVRASDVYMLEALQLDEAQIAMLVPEPDPEAPPPPEVQELMAKIRKLDAEIAEISANATLAAELNQLKMAEAQQAMMESEARIKESMARIIKMGRDAAHNETKLNIVSQKMMSQELLKGAQFENTRTKTQADIATKGFEAQVKAAKEENAATLKNKELEIEREKIRSNENRSDTAK